MNLESVRRGLRHFSLQSLREQPMLQDSISLAVLIVAALVNVLTLLLLIIKLRHVDYPVPVHYLSLVGFDRVGSWIQNYRLATFGIAVTLINGLLAAKSFQRNRLVSFFLLVGAAVVSLLCLVISTAFAGIV